MSLIVDEYFVNKHNGTRVKLLGECRELNICYLNEKIIISKDNIIIDKNTTMDADAFFKNYDPDDLFRYLGKYIRAKWNIN